MRGNIKQRSKGSWRLRYDGPPDASGKRKQISETVRGTKKEAENVLRERLQAVEQGSYVAKSQDTVGEFLDRWLDTYAATNTSPSTQRGYAAVVRRYLRPGLGHLAVQGLTGAGIQAVYAALVERGLSATTVTHVHRVLSQALSHGVKSGLLVRNAAQAATPPRIRRRDVEMWDARTINEFLQAATGSPYLAFYHLAILTGMRRSELAGLRWQDVNLTAATLSVVRTLHRINGKGLVVSQPKTTKSRRSIALSPDAVDLLHATRGTQLERRLVAGEAWEDAGYVFTQAEGKPLHPDKVSNVFHSIVVKAGLPHLTLHGLRHAHATLLLEAGVHPKVVSERLGHASVAITLDIYSHVLPGIQAAAALAVDEQLAGHGTG